MNTYYLVIGLKEHSFEISFSAFDEVEAKSIATALTKNLKDFTKYTLFLQDYKKISN